jgi:hypothetical protein
MYTTSGVGGTTQLGMDEGDNACGLTGFYGPLTAGVVSVEPPHTLPGRWLLRVSLGNLGGWACMRERLWNVGPVWSVP